MEVGRVAIVETNMKLPPHPKTPHTKKRDRCVSELREMCIRTYPETRCVNNAGSQTAEHTCKQKKGQQHRHTGRYRQIYREEVTAVQRRIDGRERQRLGQKSVTTEREKS